jgi:hypothetical protein
MVRAASSGRSLHRVLGLVACLSFAACKEVPTESAAGAPTGRQPYDVIVDGVGTFTGEVPDGQTYLSVSNLSENEYVRRVFIQLGADFIPASICDGKTIFGRAGAAACGGAITELNLSSANIGSPTGSSYNFTSPDTEYHRVINLNMGADFVANNICSGKSLLNLSGSAPCVQGTSTTIAQASEIIVGKEAWLANGSKVTGTMSPQSFSPNTASVNAGYYDTTTLSTVDPDLSSANIKAGTSIFGINGSPSVVDTSSADAQASQIRVGKTAYVNGALITGSLPTQTLADTTALVTAG